MITLMPVRRSEIKRRRKLRGLTLAAAAGKAGWNNPQDWKRVEDVAADLRLSTIQRIAKVLECEITDLISK